MHIYDIWIINHKHVETWAKHGSAASTEEAVKMVLALVLHGRRVQKHKEDAGEIIIIVRDAEDADAGEGKIPPELFLRTACHDLGLTSSETNVLLLLMDETDNEVIGDKLNTSPLTAKKHRENIFVKLKVHYCGSAISRVKERARELSSQPDTA
jgi:ATP/maltotriose-dependent transcriptional regulator MalT